MEELPVFRAPKRRRVAKPGPEETSIQTLTRSQEDVAISLSQQDEDVHEDVFTAVSRSRKPIKPYRTGVIFTSASRPGGVNGDSLAVVPAEMASDRLKEISNRFVEPTGQVVDVDKHM